MRFEKLKDYAEIFKSDDFNYLLVNIGYVTKIIPDGIFENSESFRRELIIFQEKLKIVYELVAGRNGNKLLENGYLLCTEQIRISLALSELSDEKKSELKKSTKIKKIKKIFLVGLIRFAEGIAVSFTPDIIQGTRMSQSQILNYLLDNRVGLGKHFVYNEQGTYSFERKVGDLTREELLTAIRLLMRPGSQRRMINGWDDRGERGTRVRILLNGTEGIIRRRKKVYYIYKANEHKEYQNQLNKNPRNSVFAEAN